MKINEIFSSLGSAIHHDATNKQAQKQRKDSEAKKKKSGPITSDTLADINAKLGNTKKKSVKETTSAGGVAAVAMPIGTLQKRMPTKKKKTVKKKA